MFTFTSTNTIKTMIDETNARLKLINKRSKDSHGSDCTQYSFIYEHNELSFLVANTCEGYAHKWTLRSYKELTEVLLDIQEDYTLKY